jgi:hypothetical protein
MKLIPHLSGALKLLLIQGCQSGTKTLVFSPDHQMATDKGVVLTVQSLGKEQGQALRGGTTGVRTGSPMTAMKITVRRECTFLLQWMVKNRAAGGRDTVPGV